MAKLGLLLVTQLKFFFRREEWPMATLLPVALGVVAVGLLLSPMASLATSKWRELALVTWVLPLIIFFVGVHFVRQRTAFYFLSVPLLVLFFAEVVLQFFTKSILGHPLAVTVYLLVLSIGIHFFHQQSKELVRLILLGGLTFFSTFAILITLVPSIPFYSHLSVIAIHPRDFIVIVASLLMAIFLARWSSVGEWRFYRRVSWVTNLGTLLIVISCLTLEHRTFEALNSNLESKLVRLELQAQDRTSQRLSWLALVGEFFDVSKEPSQDQLNELLRRLNPQKDWTPTIYAYDDEFNLTWYFENGVVVPRAKMTEEYREYRRLSQDLIRKAARHEYQVFRSTDETLLKYVTPVYFSSGLAGYVLVEDPYYPNVEQAMAAIDFKPFELTLIQAETETSGFSEFRALTLFDMNQLFGVRINTEQISHFVTLPAKVLILGALLVLVLIASIFVINQNQVLHFEKQVEERIRDYAILKEEADRAKDEALDASQSKSQFLANMSHEIRSPLNVLLGASELLNASSLDSEQKELVRMFRHSGQHLLNLLNDLIDLAKIESGQIEFDRSPFTPNQVLLFIENLFRIKAKESGVALLVQATIDKDQYRLGDITRIRQILVNLVGNAFKFTEKGFISVKVLGDQQNLTFEVRDTGTGIPLHLQNAVFENFRQVDESMTRAHQGAGLGLAICKTLAEKMQGSIELDSTPGLGSCFRVKLPLPVTEAPAQTHRLIAQAGAPTPHREGLKILIVDDTEENRFLVKRFLEPMKAEISEATNGQEALNVLTHSAEQNFDLVLMDMQMPILDGYQAVMKFREWEQSQQRPPTPVIALTAHGISTERQRCLDVGCSDYLAKPVAQASLIDHVQKWSVAIS